MQITTEAIEFETQPCRHCGYHDSVATTTMSQIRRHGWPICPECGLDIDISNVVTITSAKNNSLTDNEVDAIAERITDSNFDDNVAWGMANEANLLWVNSLTDEEVKTLGE